MAPPSSPIIPGQDWDQLAPRLAGATAMVIGRPGVGKTLLVRYLAHHLAAGGRRVGLLSTDMGQTALGVPACLALALTPPWERADALWFIGDNTPVGHLLPTVVGAARLTARAREAGVQTLLVDTTGLVAGTVSRVLKYHKAVALGAEHVIAVERGWELEELLMLLGGLGVTVHRLGPVAQARDRGAAERRRYREAWFARHLAGGCLHQFPAESLVGADWTPNPADHAPAPAPGTLVGLLDAQGFCLGLGLLEETRRDAVAVYTACDSAAVVRVLTGRLRVNQAGEELHA